MKICIPTEDNRGLDARIYGHFGSAPFFALADTESGHVDMMSNAGQHHRHGECKPIDHIDTTKTDAVVCQGMGKQALASLRRGGVEVWITSADTVRDAITEAQAGLLRRLQAEQACGGHGGRHGHGR